MSCYLLSVELMLLAAGSRLMTLNLDLTTLTLTNRLLHLYDDDAVIECYSLPTINDLHVSTSNILAHQQQLTNNNNNNTNRTRSLSNAISNALRDSYS